MLNYALKNPKDSVNEMNSLTTNRHPVVIIGTGPVGIRALQLLIKQDPRISVVIYGNEPWEPYNRVQLSTFLAGELDWFGLVKDQAIPVKDSIVTHFNCPITEINRHGRYIVDHKGNRQHYSWLIIATGSSPRVPQIRGIELSGIYNFRNLTDVQQLIARRVRSRRTVIIGGGVLGLEAARAMRRSNTDVVIIDHNDRLMSSQLDEASSAILKDHVSALGIKIHLNASVREILGQKSVTGVKLRSAIQIDCDTIILATGIRPNIDLARKAGITVGRGIKVNDKLQTSDENIYAIGECAEHRRLVYGLVTPGYEQAKVAVYSLQYKKTNFSLYRPVSYQGSVTSTTLKVVGVDVFSMGDVHAEESRGIITHYVFADSIKRIYRKLIVKRGRLIGAISIGQWQQISRIQESVTSKRYIWPLQLRKFSRTGEIYSDTFTDDISSWPASTKICQCASVTRGELSKAFSNGNCSVESLASCTGASLVCGSCKPKLAQFIGSSPVVTADKRSRSLFWFSAMALAFTLLALLAPAISYNDSVDVRWQWDKIWRDNLVKQITGFSTMGFMLTAALISFRKRIKLIKWFDYANWRLLHTALSVSAIAALIAHSGLRFGYNINFYLMVIVTVLLLAGSIAGLVISLRHKMDYVTSRSVSENFILAHIIFLWPLPVLLGFHIFKTYYY